MSDDYSILYRKRKPLPDLPEDKLEIMIQKNPAVLTLINKFELEVLT
jgi:hypothetical protein